MHAGGLGGYVKDRRESLGWTQADLAVRSGVSRPYLSQIEGGRIAFPGADVRRRIAAALGVRHMDLLVAAGELATEEVDNTPGYRPFFPPGDPRAVVLELLPKISDEGAEVVMDLAQAVYNRRRSRTLLARASDGSAER